MKLNWSEIKNNNENWLASNSIQGKCFLIRIMGEGRPELYLSNGKKKVFLKESFGVERLKEDAEEIAKILV